MCRYDPGSAETVTRAGGAVSCAVRSWPVHAGRSGPWCRPRTISDGSIARLERDVRTLDRVIEVLSNSQERERAPDRRFLRALSRHGTSAAIARFSQGTR